MLAKTDERISKQVLMEKYKFIPLLSDILIKESEADFELKIMTVKTANNLIYNNTQVIVKEKELMHELVKYIEKILKPDMLSEEEKTLGYTCLGWFQTALQIPSSKTINEAVMECLTYEKMLEMLES